MANRLAQESSLYLNQHADNPVDWYPWGEEALALARRERRPILLSIGYSACHWCHVMAHESFEDEATAAVMNANYVNIKVDREQRPDLDRIYQLAHQALTRRGGGWPLTVFLAPDDLVPFYAGTYFPPQPRHGLPSFVEVLHGVRRWFEHNPQQLVQQNAALAEFLAAHGRDAAHQEPLDDTPLRIARERIEAGFDPDNGGHRGAPKFPPGTELELLLQFGMHGDQGATSIATLTLQRIAERGLHDHLGGGFFRYCVDAHWSIPHFEKMLYDNAALLAAFAQALPAVAANANQTEFATAAEGIVAWLQRDMQLPEGGYASAMDADSEGEEGVYYLWTRDQVEAVLASDELAAFNHRYGLDLAPNFEGTAWHLQRRQPLPTGVDFRAERDRLLQQRDTRIAPARDDKRLTGWNAMLARALARAARQLQRPDWLHAADAILETLRHRAWNGVRLRAVADGSPGAGFLDDHACVLDALLETLQDNWRDTDLSWARDLADTLLRDFEDAERGGFFFTPHDHEPLPQRPKPWFDEATPSGNAVAARALLRLGHLVGEPRYLLAAERTLRAGWSTLRETPHGACALLGALHDYLHPERVVVLRAGGDDAANWSEARRAAQTAGASVYMLPDDSDLLPDKQPANGGVAYVCVGMRCLAPATSPAELALRLAEADA